MTPKKALLRRLETLEAHLRSEHPNLLAVIPTFRAFDRVLYRMGLLLAQPRAWPCGFRGGR